MIKIENSDQLIKYLENWDYGKTYFEDDIIKHYAAQLVYKEYREGKFSDFDNKENIIYIDDHKIMNYIDSNRITYEDTNGLNDLSYIIKNEFDENIKSFIVAIKSHSSSVDNFISNNSKNIDDLYNILDCPDGCYIEEIIEELGKLFEI